MVLRGDVYFADLGVIFGSIQSGVRPVVVIQNDVGNKVSPTIIVVPLTSKIKRPYPFHVSLEGYKGLRTSVALCEQIVTINKSQLLSYVRHISEGDMKRIDCALLLSLGL